MLNVVKLSVVEPFCLWLCLLW